jgi:hypothetical protein
MNHRRSKLFVPLLAMFLAGGSASAAKPKHAKHHAHPATKHQAHSSTKHQPHPATKHPSPKHPKAPRH